SGAPCDARFDLLVERIAQIAPRLRTDLGIRVQRIAHPGRTHTRDEALLETFANGVDDEEPFCGNAALAGIDEPSLGAQRSGRIGIGVAKHKIRIAAAEL